MAKSISPLRYPGGKSQLYNWLLDILKRNNLQNFTYIEPFAGGAGIALQLLCDNYASKIVINDFDVAIYAFWYSATTLSSKFIQRVEEVDVSIEEWKIQKKNYLSHCDETLEELDERKLFDLGFATFFLNRTNRSGIIKAGPMGGYDQSGNFLIDSRFGKKRLIDKLELIGKFADKIKVTNEDASKMFEREVVVNGLYFIDPPYYHKGEGLYKNYFLHEDHQKLASSVFENLQETNFIITYDDCVEIRDIYSKYTSENQLIDISYSVETKRKAQEMVISNLILK